MNHLTIKIENDNEIINKFKIYFINNRFFLHSIKNHIHKKDKIVMFNSLEKIVKYLKLFFKIEFGECNYDWDTFIFKFIDTEEFFFNDTDYNDIVEMFEENVNNFLDMLMCIDTYEKHTLELLFKNTKNNLNNMPTELVDMILKYI